jgi:hypothetical protein
LLLHSCITVFLKEISNGVVILYRLAFRHKDKAGIQTSVVLDGYTSVFSRDQEGELAELYFTNTGFILLIISLACAIAMNLTSPSYRTQHFDRNDLRVDLCCIGPGRMSGEKPCDAHYGVETGWSIHLVRYSIRELLHVDLCRSSLEGFIIKNRTQRLRGLSIYRHPRVGVHEGEDSSGPYKRAADHVAPSP